MSSKILRSLIYERFPFDLRVDLELLSRRRDIMNEEKQEELFLLLRKYSMNDVVPLGPGTNRYAFKINNYVTKFATDSYGKIDNRTEFKVSKILYPDMAKVHEISSSGTMEVLEYIQPFESYMEMTRYADQIREILKRISSMYLIGDIGLTEKNYCNWGLRVGTEKPVCFDFAYIYSVKSKLLLCHHCTAGAMLIPNENYTELKCSNPNCGKIYKFEDIRRRLGNDEHNHNIENLDQDGYLLASSNVLTEIDSNRSSYLLRNDSTAKKKKKPKYYSMDDEEVPDLGNFEVTKPV